MTRPTAITAPAAAVAAGAAFVTEAVAELAHRQAETFASAGDYAIEALFAFALILGAAAWWSLRSSGAVASGRGRLGAAVAAAGQGALALSALATLAKGTDALGPVFMLGLLASLAGPAVVAFAGPRARPLGAALAVGLIASFAVGTGGTAIIGLAWLAVATMLRAEPAPARIAASAA